MKRKTTIEEYESSINLTKEDSEYIDNIAISRYYDEKTNALNFTVECTTYKKIPNGFTLIDGINLIYDVKETLHIIKLINLSLRNMLKYSRLTSSNIERVILDNNVNDIYRGREMTDLPVSFDKYDFALISLNDINTLATVIEKMI